VRFQRALAGVDRQQRQFGSAAHEGPLARVVAPLERQHLAIDAEHHAGWPSVNRVAGQPERFRALNCLSRLPGYEISVPVAVIKQSRKLIAALESAGWCQPGQRAMSRASTLWRRSAQASRSPIGPAPTTSPCVEDRMGYLPGLAGAEVKAAKTSTRWT
jgi:hypothetical protein